MFDKAFKPGYEHHITAGGGAQGGSDDVVETKYFEAIFPREITCQG